MKVKIGPYINWIGPYQIAEKLLFWMDKHEDDRVHAFGTWLAEKKDGSDSWLTKFCNWIHEKKQRKISIHIDNYDVWNANYTMALIILPMLKRLKEVKHGSGYIDDEDVPEHLRSTAASPPKKNEYDTDGNFHARYEWFLDEIIWAMSEVTNDDELSQFYDYSEVPEGTELLDKIRLAKFDEKGFKAYQERRQHALNMFGKYFETLWD